MLRASATVHCTIMISSVMPSTNDATQITGSGHSIASASGEMAMLAPISTTNSIGRRGLNRSDIRPPDDEAERLGAGDRAPGGRAAQVRARHDRPEHAERAVPGRQHHARTGPR